MDGFTDLDADIIFCFSLRVGATVHVSPVQGADHHPLTTMAMATKSHSRGLDAPVSPGERSLVQTLWD